MAGTPMRHAPLSNEQILQALSESYNVVAAITQMREIGQIFQYSRSLLHEAALSNF